MTTPNWYTSDAFKSTNLIAAFDEMPFVPMAMGQSGYFSNIQPINTTAAWIERSGKSLALLDVKPRGSEGQSIEGDKRTGNYFKVPHIPARSEILADEIQDVRAWNSETNLQSMSEEINKRNLKARWYFEYALEYHRLLSTQGLMMTHDGSIVSLYTEFGMTEDTVALALGTGSTKLLTKCAEIIDHVEDGLDGLPYTTIDAQVDSTMLVKLRTHTDFEKAYINWNNAVQLTGNPHTPVSFGGINWYRYKGTSAVKFAANEGRVIPRLANESNFVTAIAPADTNAAANTRGIPFYVMSEIMKGDKGMELLYQTNQLFVNLKPDACPKLTTN